jgi:Zn-dependent protease/CBS domain-containing protein
MTHHANILKDYQTSRKLDWPSNFVMNADTDGRHRVSLGPKQYPLFRLFGFEVKIDLSWLLLALLITWTLAAGVFPRRYPDVSREIYWWMGVAGAVGIFFSIVFHELSHSLVARRFGLPIKGITLFIFGGVAEMEEEAPSPKAEFLMAVAGPLASFLLAFVFYQVHLVATASDWHTSVIGVIYYLAYLNMMLAIFNLVPAFPLDGGRMLRATLWGWKKDLRGATRIASRIGSGFGVFLMALGIMAFVLGNFIGGMWWFLIGAFLRGAAVASYQQVLMHETLRGEPVRRFMNPNPVVIPPSTTIEDFVGDYIYRHHFKMFPVVEDLKLLGCVTTRDVKNVPRDEWGQHRVGELTTPCSPDNTVSPDRDTTKVLSAMMQPGAITRLMVVEQGRLVGVLSLKDLRELITLKLELEPPER